MKFVPFIFLFIFSFVSTSAQYYPLSIMVEDNEGRADTVQFGFRDEATLGIDTVFNEFNLYNNPYDSLEIRSIQRDSMNHNCLKDQMEQNNIYAPVNIDTKIDYRPFVYNISHESIYYNFEFKIEGYDYPIKISYDFEQLGIYERTSLMYLMDSTCNVVETFDPVDYQIPDFVTIENSDVNIITFYWGEFPVGINEKKDNEKFVIIPNPTKGNFNIKEMDPSIDMVAIIDIKGNVQVTKQIDAHHEPFEMNINHLPNGIYIVQLRDLDSGDYSTRMLEKISP